MIPEGAALAAFALTRSPGAAARATGSEWRTLDDSLTKYLERFPEAKRWPAGRPRGHEIKEIRSGGLMDHH